MRPAAIVGLALAISPGLLSAQNHSGHGVSAPAVTAPAPTAARDESLPPSEDAGEGGAGEVAAARGIRGHRLGEGQAAAATWIMYPERKDKAAWC